MDRKYKKSHCTICTICTIERESAESAESARQKNDIRVVRILRNLTFLSANFYIGGMACRTMDDVKRNGGIQSRGTTKKEELEKEKPACSDY